MLTLLPDFPDCQELVTRKFPTAMHQELRAFGSHPGAAETFGEVEIQLHHTSVPSTTTEGIPSSDDDDHNPRMVGPV
jgi:hypothetical protein